ncbi:hypothetical protein MIND_00697700 [Mycena indigotica]|uniref:Uncharacterized protein n=1 Tax=Mycena indigotica TaxID=2126181 RepID=A0A8H6SKZ2_9AGAR|nr:uncharacterized protein MIND_00697700 [Mycena indigotica]KAF7301326.1 hypothetical protein MIND_00697700 [Mycena indigotica]
MTVDDLPSFESLNQLPKFDKNEYIQTYVENQRIHLSSYVISPQRPGASNNIGFTTPILAARKRRATSQPVERNENLAKKEKVKEKSKVVKQHSKRKQHNSDDEEEEQAVRLEERRERKRAKRAIVKPANDPENNQNKSKTDNKRQKKDKKSSNAFALMHGFSAANVGKNRLTLKPPSAIGVFKKGKASLKTKSKSKQSSKPFSETQFLSGTKQAIASNISSSSSSSSEPSKVKGLAESEVWDIESIAINNQPLSPIEEEEEKEDEGQGTVIVDAKRPGWAISTVDDAPVLSSSPSLRPSESASQIANHPPRPIVPISRFFFDEKTLPVLEEVESQSSPSPVVDHSPQISNHRSRPIVPVSRFVDAKPLPVLEPVESQSSPSPIVERGRSPSPLDLDMPEPFPSSPHRSPLRFRIPARKREFAKQFSCQPRQPESDHEMDELAQDWEEQFSDDHSLEMIQDSAAISELESTPGEDADFFEDDMEFLDHQDMGGDFGFSEADWADPQCEAYGVMYDEMETISEDGISVESEQEEIHQQSDLDDGMTSYSNTIQFTEGRALLMGLARAGAGGSGGAELDVARELKGHWRRQRL